MATKTVDGRASQEWYSRPDDQRFLSLEALRENVANRKARSFTIAQPTNQLQVAFEGENELRLVADDHGRTRELVPSNWAFGQLCAAAGGAPTTWMRKLPAPLAAINLEFGLQKLGQTEGSLILGDDREDGVTGVRALTSQTYGRIWDLDVVDAVIRVNEQTGNRWKIPAASYATKNPLRATTLYASDRDVFAFLVDPDHAIEIPGESEPLFRGFYAWNSEVGAATFGLSTFLYERVCDNRTIWGITEQKELRIRHTGGAPQRFAYEGRKMLDAYANEPASKVVAGIAAAKAAKTGADKPSTIEWLAAKGFTARQSNQIVDSAIAERGGAGTIWDVVNGITAMARSITHTDARVELETKAGRLMDMAVKMKK